MTQQRALLAIRLSVRTDETTSPERQEEACRSAATHYGLSVAGVASDIDVSATKTTPWERPELGKWLNDRSHEFDRSEEHTSELQSRFDLVCRLLLEKKNNKILKG